MDEIVKEEYIGLDGDICGHGEIYERWHITKKRPDGTTYIEVEYHEEFSSSNEN